MTKLANQRKTTLVGERLFGAGGGIDLFVSGAFPQSHGLDFETSYLNTKRKHVAHL